MYVTLTDNKAYVRINMTAKTSLGTVRLVQ